MKIEPLHTEAKYTRAMKRIEYLMNMNDGEGPPPGSPGASELEIFAILAEKYEEKHFPILAPTPVEAVKFAMERQGIEQKDLARILKSRSRASEILSGNTVNLSKHVMKILHDQLHVPAEILLRGC